MKLVFTKHLSWLYTKGEWRSTGVQGWQLAKDFLKLQEHSQRRSLYATNDNLYLPVKSVIILGKSFKFNQVPIQQGFLRVGCEMGV